jgi:tRNA dimethylallyltransferase
VRLAEEACLRIAAAGKLPILSGGTGFYVRNFICGLPTGPTADPRLREEVARDLAEKGAAALRAELAGIDPRSAERIHGNDFYRLTRAIEITRLTGRPMADFAAPLAPRSLFRFAIIGIERPRKELAARIGERVDAMMAAGLAEEASALRRLGYGPDAPGMKAIGYREFFEPPSEGLASGEMRGGGSDLAKVAEAIKVDTRHYAKRQMTFFRSLPGIEWIGPDADALASRLRSIVQAPSSAL